jgi:dihydropteroate synthase
MPDTWRIKNQSLPMGTHTLVMGILNVTPDSFSDGGEFLYPDLAIAHAERMIAEGADIIDIGGESTRPGGEPVTVEEEVRRVVPVVEAIAQNYKVPISVDTTKSEVAAAAIEAGASIINDISALRFDFYVADVAARTGAGLVLMHSRGTPATLHRLPPVANIIDEVTRSLRASVNMAEQRGVSRDCLVLDPGIGFGKSPEQNVELIAKLEQVIAPFGDIPLLVGTSRKSFIGRLLADDEGDPAPPTERANGSIATIVAAVLKGAQLVRVHDVKATVEALKVADAIKHSER